MAKDAKSKTTVAEAKKKPEVKTAADVKIAEVKTISLLVILEQVN